MKKTLLLLLLVPMLNGCGLAMLVKDSENRDKLNQLEVGMSKQQVIEIMGNPYRREAYSNTEYLLYATDRWNRSSDDAYAFTPIAIENGKVVGWGSNYFQKQKERIEADININK
ncbi:MAG: DUF3192 domain-containing protein [Minisyncoccota bacterium]